MKRINTKETLGFLAYRFSQMYDYLTEEIEKIRLNDILQQTDGYFLAYRNVRLIDDFIREGLNRLMFPTEEKLFHQLLVDLAVFVCKQIYGGGDKSCSEGLDLEFEKEGVKYIVTIKSGPNWANSGQIKNMKANFLKAKKILRTNAPSRNIVAVCGCCYGRDNKPDKGEYLKLCGQRFWEFISGSNNLYTDIIEPLGHKARERNEKFVEAYAQIINKFTIEFANDFCEDGKISWVKLVKFNSSAEQPEKIKQRKK
jgi:hypothetical protein